jgi:4'-phosphopantetheinyl transferase
MPNGLRLARRFFSRQEAEALAGVPEQDLDHGFFACWTCKEAYIKATGRGLAMSLRSFNVSLVPGKRAALMPDDAVAGHGSAWDIRVLRPAPGYIGALVAEGRDWEARLFTTP